MATVELIDVGKTYAEHKILAAINLRIEKGEFVAVVGPSGSGKSTLLRLVAGLEELSEGQILINNTCVNKIPPAARDMAMVFQHYALYPHMTVYENMAYGLKMRSLKKAVIQERVLSAAKMLQLTNYLDRKPQSLSGGQRQRVAMGRAMVRSPAVFLFDEPLSNLDAKLRTEMRHEIKRLHQQFRTTSLYVTHDQTEAMTLADRIVILNHGSIEQLDTPAVVYQRPASVFVASFIGNFPTNFLKGMVNCHSKQIECEVGITLPWPNFLRPPEHQQPILVAVRPEHWIINNSKLANGIFAKPEFIDDMGADKLVQVITEQAAARLLLRMPCDFNLATTPLCFTVNLSKANIFCTKTEARLGDWHEAEKN